MQTWTRQILKLNANFINVYVDHPPPELTLDVECLFEFAVLTFDDPGLYRVKHYMYLGNEVSDPCRIHFTHEIAACYRYSARSI